LRGLREKELQKFLEQNLWMLGFEYSTARPQKIAGPRNRLDFLAERPEGSFDIVELKRASFPLFRRKSKRPMISAHLKDAIGQVIDYIDFYLEKRQEEAPDDLSVYKPRGIIVIGRTVKGEERQLRKVTFYLNNIDVLTYDTVLSRAKNVVKWMTKHP
jgi:hypothetical protein